MSAFKIFCSIAAFVFIGPLTLGIYYFIRNRMTVRYYNKELDSLVEAINSNNGGETASIAEINS